MLADACVSALLLHGRDVGGLEIDNAFLVAGLLSLVHEFGGGEKAIGLGLSDRIHD